MGLATETFRWTAARAGAGAGRDRPAPQAGRAARRRHGALIKVWPSQKTAAEALGIKHGSISAAVLGRNKLGGGFEWRASAPRAQPMAAQSATRPQAKAAQRATRPQPKAAQRVVRRSARL